MVKIKLTIHFILTDIHCLNNTYDVGKYLEVLAEVSKRGYNILLLKYLF